MPLVGGFGVGVSVRRPASAYRPRRPRDSPLWRLLDRHYDEFEGVYDERYQKRYGFWRPVIQRTVRKFLACGDLREGFARVRCPKCRYEFFVAFSCRRRCLCPSCHQKRALLIADRIARDVCEPVPHRQFVLTIPKRLRIFFRFDRRLLGELSRLAWETVLEVSRAALDHPDLVPGMVATIHTFGELIHWHPHIHALVSDGAFAPDGMLIPMPPIDAQVFEKLWQKKVFDLLLKENKITETLVTQMKLWRHSGFSVHSALRLEAGALKGLQRLARYMLRCPFSLARMIRVNDRGQVVYRAQKSAPQRSPSRLTSASSGTSAATSSSSIPWTSSPRSLSTSPTMQSISSASTASIRIKGEVCEPRPLRNRSTASRPTTSRRLGSSGPAVAGPP